MTKAELKRRMPVAEYREWIAFYAFEAKYIKQQASKRKG